MKHLLISMLFLFTGFNSNPPVIKSISLEGYYKVESTFSGNTIDNNSFYIIIAKNIKTKNFHLIPITYQGKILKRLKPVVFNKKPSVLSFHNNKESLTLITSKEIKKDKFINVLDINLLTGESDKSDNIPAEEFKTLIRKETNNLLVFVNEEEIRVLNVTNSTTINEVVVETTKENKDFIEELEDGSIEAINNDEFVSNGSIGDLRVYSENDNIIFTKEEVENNETTVVKLSLNTGDEVNLVTKKYKNDSPDKMKKSTSYISDDKLYQLNLNKEKGGITIYNLSDDKKTNLNFNKTGFSKSVKGFKNIKEFLKQSSKNANAPTVTVNKTKKGNLVLRVDYVKKNEYNYRYDWWWHHNWMMQQMMFQQQQMRATMPQFGPSVEGYDNVVFFSKDENHYFEIVLTSNSDILSNIEEETIHKDIDKKKYITELNDNSKLKHSSSVFVENTFRYFAYDKKSKVFKIYENKINDKL